MCLDLLLLLVSRFSGTVSVVNDVYDVLVKKVSTVDAQNKRHQKYKKVRSTSKLLSGPQKNGDIEDLLLETHKIKYIHHKYFQTKISGVTLIDLFSDL